VKKKKEGDENKKGKRKNMSRRIKRQKEEALGRSPNQYISKRKEGGL
jgi:hypothetical protein